MILHVIHIECVIITISSSAINPKLHDYNSLQQPSLIATKIASKMYHSECCLTATSYNMITSE